MQPDWTCPLQLSFQILPRRSRSRLSAVISPSPTARHRVLERDSNSINKWTQSYMQDPFVNSNTMTLNCRIAVLRKCFTNLNLRKHRKVEYDLCIVSESRKGFEGNGQLPIPIPGRFNPWQNPTKLDARGCEAGRLTRISPPFSSLPRKPPVPP